MLKFVVNFTHCDWSGRHEIPRKSVAGGTQQYNAWRDPWIAREKRVSKRELISQLNGSKRKIK